MNKAISLLTILLLTLCQAQAQEKNDRERWKLTGPVRSITVEKVVLENDGKRHKSTELLQEASFDERGNQTFTKSYDPHLSRYSSNKLAHSYDDRGKIIKTSVYEADGTLTMRQEYFYDERGRKIRADWKRANDIAFHRINYSYNSQGHLTEESTRFLHGLENRSRTTYEYDQKGRRTEIIRFSEQAPQPIRTACEYDDSARRDVTTVYDAAGQVRMRWDYRYDLEGREIEVYVYGQDANLARHSTMAYESDSQGNWIKLKITREVYQDGQPQPEHEVQRRTIIYY